MNWLWTAFFTIAASASRPGEPIQVEHIIRANPPMRMHVARIDLTDSAITLRVVASGGTAARPGGWETSLALPTEVADREHFCLAVNGNLFRAEHTLSIFDRQTPYFVTNPAAVLGWAMTDGRVWAKVPEGYPALVVFADGRVSIGLFARLPVDARQAVSGSDLIEVAGRNVAPAIGKVNEPYPRTAVGIDNSGRRLVLLVVDGHRPASMGLTMSRLADEMIHLGCANAMCLDGGGSSVMVQRIADGAATVISRPSDGYDLPFSPTLQRPVASVLGISCATQPTTTRSLGSDRVEEPRTK